MHSRARVNAPGRRVNIHFKRVAQCRRPGKAVEVFAPGTISQWPLDENHQQGEEQGYPCGQAEHNDFQLASPHTKEKFLQLTLVDFVVGVTNSGLVAEVGYSHHG